MEKNTKFALTAALGLAAAGVAVERIHSALEQPPQWREVMFDDAGVASLREKVVGAAMAEIIEESGSLTPEKLVQLIDVFSPKKS